MSVNVVCLKWGAKYPAEYVNRLRRMTGRAMSLPHRFVCITDERHGLDKDIETKPILYPELTGWWHKLTLFRRELYDLKGRTLFLDLDTVIVEGLDNFFTHPGDFCIIRDWGGTVHNSGIFRLEIGAHPQVWEQFVEDHREITRRLRGDQDWLTAMLPQAVGWPKGWVKSFKLHLNHQGAGPTVELPDETLIVAFHGRPQPHEVIEAGFGKWKQAPWVGELWGRSFPVTV
jgi:hypothetical protein